MVSIIFASSSFFQNLHIDVLAQNLKNPKLFSPSNHSEANDLSKIILDKYKHRVLEHLFNNKTIADTISNSSIPVSIVIGVISPNGTQVSGFGNISKANSTTVDGNTIFDIGFYNENICCYCFGRFSRSRSGETKRSYREISSIQCNCSLI